MVENIFEVYSEKEVQDMDFNGKLFIINFDHIDRKNWGASDFLAICEQTPMVLLYNLKVIDLTDRNLSRRFILFIGMSWLL
jgi:predicted ATPase